jgi:hypothetical protein
MLKKGFQMNKNQRFRQWMVFLLFTFICWCICTGSKAFTADSSLNKEDTALEESCNVIEGFKGNTVEAEAIAATISGGGLSGLPNRVNANMGTIGGGIGNQAGELGTVSGGSSNTATGFRASVGGGGQNTADRDSTTIGGGYGNAANGSYATIGGGTFNAATEVNATVSGGSGNVARERHSTVGGGSVNTAAGFAGTIAGGIYNKAMATYSTVSGGIANISSRIGAAVSGGTGNVANGENATVSGGMNNRVTDNYGTIAGGRRNIAGNFDANPVDAMYATVGGGTENVARGSFSVIPGGSSNLAAADYSFAAGRRAIISADHRGAFLYADSQDFDFHSAAANELAVRATGGFRFFTATDIAGNPSTGARLLSGSGTWESFSDRNAKTFFGTVDRCQILEHLSRLPITTWSYKTQMSHIRHLGPTAQDFYEVFGLGDDDKYISTVDADGVALAAIQALYELIKEKEVQIKTQQKYIGLMKADMIALRDQVISLEGRLAELETGMAASKK